MAMDNKKVKDRNTLYIRPRKDDDIRNYLQQFLNKGDDFSHTVRKLLEDGIEYRKLLRSGRLPRQYVEPTQSFTEQQPEYQQEQPQNPKYDNVIQSNTFPKQDDDFNFDDVEIKKIKPSREELENKLSGKL